VSFVVAMGGLFTDGNVFAFRTINATDGTRLATEEGPQACAAVTPCTGMAHRAIAILSARTAIILPQSAHPFIKLMNRIGTDFKPC